MQSHATSNSEAWRLQRGHIFIPVGKHNCSAVKNKHIDREARKCEVSLPEMCARAKKHITAFAWSQQDCSTSENVHCARTCLHMPSPRHPTHLFTTQKERGGGHAWSSKLKWQQQPMLFQSLFPRPLDEKAKQVPRRHAHVFVHQSESKGLVSHQSCMGTEAGNKQWWVNAINVSTTVERPSKERREKAEQLQCALVVGT